MPGAVSQREDPKQLQPADQRQARLRSPGPVLARRRGVDAHRRRHAAVGRQPARSPRALLRVHPPHGLRPRPRLP
ncbi:hypothetical protein ACFPRL_24875 [Pseudoclavibacter helvolus]